MAQKQRVRVTRALRHRGNDVGIGSVLELDRNDALELRSGNKVEFVASDTKLEALPVQPKQKRPSLEEQQRQNLEVQQQQVAALTAAVEALTGLVKKLSDKGKEKANA